MPCHVVVAPSGPCCPYRSILVCPAWPSCAHSWCRRWAGLAWASGASGSVVCCKKNKSALRGWFCQVLPLRRPAPGTIHGLGTLGASRVPPRRHMSFRATPAWGQLPMREVGPCMLVLRASGCARASWPSRPGKKRCACVDRTMGARPSDTGRTSPGTSPHTGRGRARATPPCRPRHVRWA